MAADSPVYECSAMKAWLMQVMIRDRLIPLVLFKSEGGSMEVDERNSFFSIFKEEALTQKEFVTIYDMTKGLESFATHLAAMANFCLECRPITDKSLLFTVVILPSSAARAVLNGLMAVVPPSKPLYVVGTEEEAWDVVSNGGLSSSLWRAEI